MNKEKFGYLGYFSYLKIELFKNKPIIIGLFLNKIYERFKSKWTGKNSEITH